MSEITVVIPNYNGMKYLAECMTSLCREQQNAPGYEVLIIDNASVDGSVEYLQKEFGRAITLDELSAVVGLSKEYMCSYFKKKMNKTIMQVLCDIRIMNACVMLNRFPDKKIAEISKKCGFESPSYFGAVFRKHRGMTPDTYRKWIPIEHK